jgi:transcriptional regulator of aromatic amino acid metabolism
MITWQDSEIIHSKLNNAQDGSILLDTWGPYSYSLRTGFLRYAIRGGTFESISDQVVFA